MTEQNVLDMVGLEHRSYVEQIRYQYHHELSSHAFANLFLWKDQMHLKICLKDENYYVKTDSEGPNAWFFPCGAEEGTQKFIEQHRLEPDFCMVYLREEDKAFLETMFPGVFLFSPMRESDEYIFDRTELEKHEGAKYANLRNQMNRLFREHEIISKPYAEAEEGMVWDLLNRPLRKKHFPGYHALNDNQIPQTAMKFRKELGMQLVTVWVDGVLRGVTMGFVLTGDTIDGCVERHDPGISGLSGYTQMSLLLQAPPQYRYMNGEEDLGLTGLRTMKQHMNPCRMNRIWRADIKK